MSKIEKGAAHRHTIYIADEYYDEAIDLCGKMRPKKSFCNYYVEALVAKNDKVKKELGIV